MTRLLIDLPSVCWTSLLSGHDAEFGTPAEHNGKPIHLNSARHGYENAIETILAAARHAGAAPSDFILVGETGYSRKIRALIYDGYKSKSGDKPLAAYDAFNETQRLVIEAFSEVGAAHVTQPDREADDLIAYLAGQLAGELCIVSNDGDLAALLRPGVTQWKSGSLCESNPFGPFDIKYIRLYKALVGDSSDTYPGAKGFGDKAFLDLAITFGDAGLDALIALLKKEEAYFTKHQKVSGEFLATLAEDVAELKSLQKIIDHADMVVRCWLLAKLYPESINTKAAPLAWKPGFLSGEVADERLRPYARQCRLITASNYEAAVRFLQAKLPETSEFCLDLETATPAESDEWLEKRKGKRGVDVIASTITGCGLSFGANNQYGYYVSVDHKETDNVTLEQLRQLLELIPKEKLTIAHNAAGFELPVLYKAFGESWRDNGWRGFYPNMVDSRIAASYWDENQHSHGLKALSKLLLGYEQTSYETVVTIDGAERKMNELSAEHVLDYGLDDVFCTMALWKHFRRILEIEDTYHSFLATEQKPMYLSALSYVRGTPFSLQRLREMSEQDDAAVLAHEAVLHRYLAGHGKVGCQCPEFTLSPAGIKVAVRIILGVELKTQVRTIPKLVELIEKLDHPDAGLLARLIHATDAQVLSVPPDRIQCLMHERFQGIPEFNPGSPKQVKALLYETMGLPIRLRNRATETMRKNGFDQGSPRTDDEALQMAIQQGDANEETRPVLEALMALRSIQTRRGLYWDAYPKLRHWQTERLHPELRQCATNTRRHTSGNPNIQQLDKEPGGVRSIILPHKKDAVIVSCDLSGQEIRLLAEMSGDENMCSAYLATPPRDLHSFTAAMIQGVSYEEFRARLSSPDEAVAAAAAEARQIGKIVFFASSYGAGAAKIAETLGVDEAQGETYLQALDRAFPRVTAWKRETEALANRQGWVPIYGGGRRHLAPLLASRDAWEAQKALRQASNARIQSAGGNQLRRIMGRIWDSRLLDDYDFQFYWPVHDEVVFSVGREDAVEVIFKLHNFMCEKFLERIPSASSIGIGKDFGNLIEIGERADPDLIAKTLEAIRNA